MIFFVIAVGIHSLQPVNNRNVALYASLRAPFESNSAANYAVAARRAIDDGLLDKARASYAYYVDSFAPRQMPPPADTAQILLRWALLEQRASNVTGAREVFKLGARLVMDETRKSDDARVRAAAATLFCSWGLAEHRHRATLGSRVALPLALLRHATVLDDSKAAVLRWKMFSATEERAEPAEAPPKPKKMVPPKKGIPLSELPKRGEPDDPFVNNRWKRSIMERYERMHNDILAAAARGDAPGVEAAARALETRRGKRTISQSKDLVAGWALRWSCNAPADGFAIRVYGPDDAPAMDPGLRDPVLDAGARYRCAVASTDDGAIVPAADDTLAFVDAGALPFPERLLCTYLDERILIMRKPDAREDIVVFEKDRAM